MYILLQSQDPFQTKSFQTEKTGVRDVLSDLLLIPEGI